MIQRGQSQSLDSYDRRNSNKSSYIKFSEAMYIENHAINSYIQPTLVKIRR